MEPPEKKRFPSILARPVRTANGGLRRPTQNQLAVVEKVKEMVVEGRDVSQAKILRAVGYSEPVANHPDRVFGSATMIALMDQNGLSETDLSEGHKYLFNAQRGEHAVFPPYDEEGNDEHDEGDLDNGAEVERDKPDDMFNGKTRKEGERMTDQHIRDFIQSFGGIVHRIVHGATARHVYYRIRDARAVKEALDMAYQIRGTYAPKRVEGKHSHQVGVYSMAKLREKMKSIGAEVIVPPNE